MSEARISRITAAVAIASLMLVPATALAAAPAASGNDCSDKGFNTFHVAISAPQTKYRKGDAVRIRVVVSRELRTDGQEHRFKLGTVEGATVDLALLSTDGLLVSGSGTTDTKGTAWLRVELPLDSPTGRLDVVAYSERQVAEVECVPHEYGRRVERGMIRVRAK